MKIRQSILSVPSWVIPGTYAENLRFLEDKKEIQGVELLFFLYDDEIKAQFDSEWEEISRYGKRFVFTAHLPELLLPAHGELIARLTPLVKHFIVHPPVENPENLVRLLTEWRDRHEARFLAENTKAGLLEAMLPLPEAGMGICMDTGHLLLDGKNPADFFTAYRERIGEIHLHGVDQKQAAIDGRLPDHRRLRGNEDWLLELLPLLEDYSGVINLEVFSWEEVKVGIDILCFPQQAY
jgi:hypothetical protein